MQHKPSLPLLLSVSLRVPGLRLAHFGSDVFDGVLPRSSCGLHPRLPTVGYYVCKR